MKKKSPFMMITNSDLVFVLMLHRFVAHFDGKRSPFMMIIDFAFVLMFDRFVEHYDGKR